MELKEVQNLIANMMNEIDAPMDITMKALGCLLVEVLVQSYSDERSEKFLQGLQKVYYKKRFENGFL